MVTPSPSTPFSPVICQQTTCANDWLEGLDASHAVTSARRVQSSLQAWATYATRASISHHGSSTFVADDATVDETEKNLTSLTREVAVRFPFFKKLTVKQDSKHVLCTDRFGGQHHREKCERIRLVLASLPGMGECQLHCVTPPPPGPPTHTHPTPAQCQTPVPFPQSHSPTPPHPLPTLPLSTALYI